VLVDSTGRQFGVSGLGFLDPYSKGADLSVSNGGSTVRQFVGAANNGSNIRGTKSFSSTLNSPKGFIVSADSVAGFGDGSTGVGFASDLYVPGVNGAGTYPGGANGHSICYYDDGSVLFNNSSAVAFDSWGTGDVIEIRCDLNGASAKVAARVNGGNWNANVANDPTVGAASWNIDGSLVYAVLALLNARNAFTVTNAGTWT
jgi:hypothetical protein